MGKDIMRTKELFKYQSQSTIKYIMINQKVSVEKATNMWYSSKTRKYLEEHDMYWVAPSRCYDEFEQEQKNSPYWMTEPFD